MLRSAQNIVRREGETGYGARGEAPSASRRRDRFVGVVTGSGADFDCSSPEIHDPDPGYLGSGVQGQLHHTNQKRLAQARVSSVITLAMFSKSLSSWSNMRSCSMAMRAIKQSIAERTVTPARRHRK
jgi:hypothetical protein